MEKRFWVTKKSFIWLFGDPYKNLNDYCFIKYARFPVSPKRFV